jgi:hypothetical protein
MQNNGEKRDRGASAVHLLAGLADLALSQVAQGARKAAALLGRADLKEIVRDGHDDLKARGELALARYANASEPHMETLAKRVVARKSRNDA